MARKLIADGAYDNAPLDEKLKEKDIDLIAPHQRNRVKPTTQGGRKLRRHKRRWLIEHYFAWLQWQRRLITRWELHMQNILGFVQRASIKTMLRQF